MKIIRCFYALLILFSLSARADLHSNNKISDVDVNGIWEDVVSGPTFAHCYLIMSQDGTTARMTHYMEFNGMPMVEFGEGKVTGNKVHLDVKITKPIPGWATTGVHDLQLSDDGNSLQGHFEDAKGNRGPLLFTRIHKMNTTNSANENNKPH